MIHVITSSINDKSIHDEKNDFILVKTELRPFIARWNEEYYQFDLYYKDDMELDSSKEYTGSNNLQYGFHPVSTVAQALEQIIKDIHNYYIRTNIDNEESMTVIACDYNLNRQITNYINSIPDTNQNMLFNNEIGCNDIYRTLKLPSKEHLTKYLKSSLNSEFIYPDDPVSYGYAIHKVLEGSVR